MQKLILVLSIFLYSTVIYSQDTIPNADFEYWTNEASPVGWTPHSVLAVYRSSASYSGNYSMVVRTWYHYSTGIVSNTPGTPIGSKPGYLRGFYKYFPGDIDSSQNSGKGAVTVVLTRYNPIIQKRDTVGFGELEFTPVDTWTGFSVSLEDLIPGIQPDSIYIRFLSASSGNWSWCDYPVWDCNFLHIDALSLSDTQVNTKKRKPAEFMQKIYPNPTKGILNISLPENLKVQSIQLHDMQGRLIKSFPPVERTLNMENVANGRYLLIVEGEDGVLSKKVVVW